MLEHPSLGYDRPCQYPQGDYVTQDRVAREKLETPANGVSMLDRSGRNATQGYIRLETNAPHEKCTGGPACAAILPLRVIKQLIACYKHPWEAADVRLMGPSWRLDYDSQDAKRSF